MTQIFINVGNYLIKANLLNSKSIIYSFGIGENLGFEKKLQKNLNV